MPGFLAGMERRKGRPVNVLITGGFGCIGSYVIRDLLRAGETAVVYDLLEDHTIPRMVLTPQEIDQIRFVQGDITDLPSIMRAVKVEKIDRIVHLASWQVPACQANPAMALRVVCEGTVNIFEAQRVFELPRLVWASSVAVFGSPADYGGNRVTNDDPHYPKFVYGACKSLCERYADHYFAEYGCDNIGLRFTSVYGVGRTRGMSSFTTKMIEAAAYGESYAVPFGDDIVDWQFVEDVATVVTTALAAATTRTRTFTVKGDYRSVQDGVDAVRALAPGADLSVEGGVFGIQWDYDASALEDELGFVPAYGMEAGIQHTLDRFAELRPMLRP